jgi:hypothetical protein
LEDAILRELERFILELGKGFTFVERQKRMIIDGEDHHLDLLFFQSKIVPVGAGCTTSKRMPSPVVPQTAKRSPGSVRTFRKLRNVLPVLFGRSASCETFSRFCLDIPQVAKRSSGFVRTFRKLQDERKREFMEKKRR